MIKTKRKLLLTRHPFSNLPRIFPEFDIAEFYEAILGYGPYDVIVNTCGYDPKSDREEIWKHQLDNWRLKLTYNGEFIFL
jgi:hypothetical protein